MKHAFCYALGFAAALAAGEGIGARYSNEIKNAATSAALESMKAEEKYRDYMPFVDSWGWLASKHNRKTPEERAQERKKIITCLETDLKKEWLCSLPSIFLNAFFQLSCKK